MKIRKTNAMRHLDDLGLPYQSVDLHLKEAADAPECARLLGVGENQVFKTLVTEDGHGGHYVFMLPANEHLSLKKGATAAGVKKIEMLPQKKLLPATGYVHGGCSPLGMKKHFETWIDRSALECDQIWFSGGKIGVQIGMDPRVLCEQCGIQPADLAQE